VRVSSSNSTLERECFFIAPIGEEGSPIRRRSDPVHRHIVSPAAKAVGLKAVRADELAAPGRITNQIIDHLLHARTAVADLTGRNPNVFYELGVRHMANLAQMRVIRYDHTSLDSAERCRQTLVEHLRAGLEGAVDSPISDFEHPPSGNRFEQWFSEMVDDLRETVAARPAEDLKLREETGEADPEADGESRAKQFRHDFDHRPLSETGIRPGMRLEAIRPPRRLFRQHP
jgi:hypothetical protein